MILTEQALRLINVQNIRLLLAIELGYTEAWIITLIDKNKRNSPLTTASALKVIKQETGLSEEEILEEETIKESTK